MSPHGLELALRTRMTVFAHRFLECDCCTAACQRRRLVHELYLVVVLLLREDTRGFSIATVA